MAVEFTLSLSLSLSLSLFAIDAPKYCTCRLQSDAGDELQRKSERNCALNQSLYNQSRRNHQMFNSSCRLAGKQLSRHRLSSVFYHLRRLRIITASNKYWNDLLPTYTAKSDARIQNWNESSSNFVWVCVSVVCVRACSFSLFFSFFCFVVYRKSLDGAECIWYTGIPLRVVVALSHDTSPYDIDF